MIIVASFNLMLNYGYGAWIAPFAVQRFDAPLSEIGFKLGFAAVLAGGAGTITFGWIADKVRARYVTGRLWVLLFTTVTPVPLAFVTLHQNTLDVFILWYMLSFFVLSGWLPCCVATMHDLVLPRMRGSAIAMMYLIVTIAGMGTGPYLVGLVSDITGDLRLGIFSIFSVALVVWCATLVALRHVARDESSLALRVRGAGELI